MEANNCNDPLRVGMIGVANFGWQRREYMRQTGLFKIEAIFDFNETAMRDCAEQDGGQIMGSPEELFNFPGLEAVIISTGANSHAEYSLAAIRAGLPVFVEKPLCSTPSELAELTAVVEESGLPFVVGHDDLRANSHASLIRQMIDSGELGTICAFERTTAHSGGHQVKPGDWRGDPTKNPGGMLFQCGVHGLHELMYYFGPIEEVTALMRYDILPTQTADVAICQLRCASGVVGILNAYHCTPFRHTLSIFGTEASLYRDDRYYDEGTKLLIQRRHPQGGAEPQSVVANDDGKDPCSCLRTFYRAVRENDPTLCYPGIRDASLAVAVTFAAEESSRVGGPISVDRFFPSPAKPACGLTPAENRA